MTRDTILTLTPNPALDLWTTTPSVTAGPKLRCTRPDTHPGGGGINVSRVARRLGGATRALFASGGRTGQTIAAALENEDVPAEPVPVAGAARESFSVRETDTGKVFRFVTPGSDLAPGEPEALLDRLGDLAASAALAVGSGSLPGGAGADFWAAAATRCRAAGARFFLDSHDSIGPALEAGVFCLRENTDAFAAIAGETLTWPHGAAGWARDQVRAGRAEVIVATEGDDGALMVTADACWVVEPPRVTVNSAIGAGDSFVAGLCLGFLGGETPGDTLRRAVATAAATLLTSGTELCRAGDVARLLEETGPARQL